jgi:hypothetical protein
MITQKTVLLLLLAGVLPAIAQLSSGVAAQTDDPAHKWSKRQMSHMLADRPIMKNYQVGKQIFWVSQQDSIWQWVAERYAGKTTRFWTAWHEAPPTDNAGAMHAYGKDKAYLYLEDLSPATSGSHNETFEKLWSRAVFELLNLENAEGFNEATTAAYEGKCTRNEFVRKYAALEQLALGKLQLFQKDVWIPWCKANGFVSDSKIWRHGYHPNFESWLSQYPQDSWYPWQGYGEVFDSIRRKSEKQAGKSKAAIK